MIQNAENIEIKITFPSVMEKSEIKSIVESMGVKFTLLKISEDLERNEVSFITKYAWRLVAIDRLFHNGAEIILIKRIN